MNTIKRIIYLEDSDDEVFLTRILFKRERVVPELVHYDSFDRLNRDLERGALRDLSACVVLVDLNLKPARGIDAIRQLRGLPTVDIAALGVCSGSVDPADRHDSLEAGADFFVGKPLDTDCLQRICAAVPDLRCVRDHDGSVRLVRASA